MVKPCETCKRFKTPYIAVDGLIISDGRIALIKRVNEPFKDQYAFPGGFLEYGETVKKALIREMKEETNLLVAPKRLVGIYSKPNRDPRGQVISMAFLCKVVSGTFKTADDAKEGIIVYLDDAIHLTLAFDHNIILNDCIRKGLIAKIR